MTSTSILKNLGPPKAQPVFKSFFLYKKQHITLFSSNYLTIGVPLFRRGKYILHEMMETMSSTPT